MHSHRKEVTVCTEREEISEWIHTDDLRALNSAGLSNDSSVCASCG